MAKKDEKEIESKFPELEKTDTDGEPANKIEFRRIIAKYKDEKPESYERSKEEYERILVKLNNPDEDFRKIGFTSYQNNNVIG